jgi:flagellar motor switch protein FliN/FliY
MQSALTPAGSGLADAFGYELAKAVESTTGERPEVVTGGGVSMPAGEAVAFRQEFAGAGLQTAWIVAEFSVAVKVGSRLLRAAGIDDHNDAEAKSTYLESVSQAVSSLARTVAARDGRQIACAEGSESTAPADLALVPVRLTFPDASVVTIYVHFSEDEKNTLSTERSILSGCGLSKAPQNLDLLLDVELPVTVSFGRAQLPLKDVVKLTTGSIIELNRTLSEPVELIVNNCVIAKGEVVVVDGNFAVRIQRVVSRQERLRSIG